MSRYHHAYKIPILSGRFHFAGQRTVGGQARLYSDRIELEGWSLKGRFRHRILLVQIVDMHYHPLDQSGNLTMVLDNEQEMKLVVQDAHRWQMAFDNWLSYHVLASAKFIPEQEQAYAIAG
jgi:hypothetical protein